MSPWLLLAVAVMSEVAGTIALRSSDGFTRPLPVGIVIVGYGFAFYLLSLITRHLPLSTIYAVWSGAGISLIALIGFVVLQESMSPLKVISLILIGNALTSLLCR
jgi:multidrug transporter EmrE-like cation transporter